MSEAPVLPWFDRSADELARRLPWAVAALSIGASVLSVRGDSPIAAFVSAVVAIASLVAGIAAERAAQTRERAVQEREREVREVAEAALDAAMHYASVGPPLW